MGPVVGIVGILRVLSSETRTLVVCRKGLRLEGFGIQSPIPWSSLKGMAVRGRWPRTVLVLNIETSGERGELTLPSRWIGMSGQRLCSRVLEIQRRALLGVPERLPEP